MANKLTNVDIDNEMRRSNNRTDFLTQEDVR
jgi:hypothetical protein